MARRERLHTPQGISDHDPTGGGVGGVKERQRNGARLLARDPARPGCPEVQPPQREASASSVSDNTVYCCWENSGSWSHCLHDNLAKLTQRKVNTAAETI